jgi:hypothetical protein
MRMKQKNEFVCRLLVVWLLAAGVACAQTDAPAEQQPASLSGVVSNSLTGEPLAHARIILYQRLGDRCLMFRNDCPLGLTTADGRFSISKITPGKYQMFVGRTPSLKLLPAASTEYFALDAPIQGDNSFKLARVFPGRYHVLGEDLPQGSYVKSAHIGTSDLQDGILDLRNTEPKAEMTIQLGANGAEVSGVVRDTKGPAPGVRVALFFDDEHGIDLAATSATGADGGYALYGIAPGKYKVIAFDSKTSPEVWSSDAMTLHESVTEHIDVHEGDKVFRDLKLLTRP